MPEYRNILCCTDFSQNAGVAFQEAAYIAALAGAHLTLLHVIHAGVGEAALALPADQVAAEDDAGLGRMVREYPAPTEVEMNYSVRHGNIAAEILEAAEEMGAELIVIGARGLTRWEAFMGGGSIAEKVVRHAKTAVVVVPAH